MGSEGNQLHVIFFPLMAHGHMIPLVDMAKLFASRGLKTTIVTTPLNVSLFSRTVQRTQNLGFDINIRTIEFSTAETGLPEGCENADFFISQAMGWEMVAKFFVATAILREPLERLLEEIRPDCLIADMFFPWTTDTAAKFGIPRLVFHGTSFFSLCVGQSLRLYEPHKKVSSDCEPFLMPNLPDDITLTRNELPRPERHDDEPDFSKMYKQVKEGDLKSYGVVVNSFYELEPAYADHYRKAFGRKAWHVGPVSLCNRNTDDKAERGREASINENECLKWLESKKPNSVVYICFGSMVSFSASQLKEIAKGLEASGQQFIWVEAWLPARSEKRMEGKGLIIRGWAPQVLILDHEAIGGFVTHCGWNSTVEGIAAGVPMATCPLSAEQFYNEKLVTQILKIGIRIGVQEQALSGGDSIKSEALEKAVSQLMEGEEAEEMRSRAAAYGKMARKAVEEGGSSYSDLNALIDELSFCRQG
ncbi:scopoletin glucosyltransferase [Salix suchowensis]|nr:scopoletin glucosyltransferase [Salix suchowensis]